MKIPTAYKDNTSLRRPTCPSTLKPISTKSRCASINARDRPWALKPRRVNCKPVLHRPVEPARRNIRRRPLGLGCELYLTAGKERSYGRHEVYRNGCSQGLDLDRGAVLVVQAGDGMRHRNQGDYDSRVRAWTAWEFASDV